MPAPKTPEEALEQARIAWHLRIFGYHRLAFVLVNVSLTAVNIYTGAPWWALMPLLCWSVPFAIHFFYVKAASVDEEWVDYRSLDLRSRSYDFQHIRDLENRIVSGDFSVDPHTDRESGTSKARDDC